MDIQVSGRRRILTDSDRWAAIDRRDPEADGSFVYSVRTTGVYCRPSCASRRARRENVAFHATCADAERAGFRPCKRCRPDAASRFERHLDAVRRACALIDQAETPPSLDELATIAGLSRHHFHRIFRTTTGVTPKAYASQRRAARIAEGLETASTITAALYDAGFNAASRFYDAANARLGMTPGAYRAGGRGLRIRFAVTRCSLGAILVAATDKGLCAILLGEDPLALERELRERFPHAGIVDADADFERTVEIVLAFLEAPRGTLDLPLDIVGTAFQQRVWAALRKIPAGTTATYAEIAAAIHAPRAHRAVAGACAANPIAVAIPCHRVVRTDGGISGYRWGVDRKRDLIARERRDGEG